MPPIFGMICLNQSSADPEAIGSVREALKYHKARLVREVGLDKVFLACATAGSKDADDSNTCFVYNESWVVLADATFYGQPGFGVQAILETYLRWGEDCLSQLRGDFAFTILNRKTGEIFCARDHFGVRPFFYSISGEGFNFASELRVLKASLRGNAKVRRDYLLDTLVSRKTINNLACFEDTFRLPPAHFLRLHEGRLTVKPYWKIDLSRKILLGSKNEYVDFFRSLLVKAVVKRASHVGAMGAELSGGLDSSAICGIASQERPKNTGSLTAFSNVLPTQPGLPFTDERIFIRAISEMHTLSVVEIAHQRQPLLSLLQSAMQVQGCFLQQGFSIFNEALHHEAGNRGIEVVLSGFGGDEMVSSSGVPIKDERGLIIRVKKNLRRRFWNFVPSLFWHSTTGGRYTPEWTNRRFSILPLRDSFARTSGLPERMAEKYKRPLYETEEDRQLAWLQHEHVCQRLEYDYASAAQHGLEYRYPLLDLDLIEAYLAFPSWGKHHSAINRSLFREAANPYLPKTILQRNDKSGMTIPHIFYSLSVEKNDILNLIQSFNPYVYPGRIFDLPRLAHWCCKLADWKAIDFSGPLPGLFFNYLLILLYYRNEED
jgi:asparagine synthase (glutamine-hydrolysing)